jgi:hypothetical protein
MPNVKKFVPKRLTRFTGRSSVKLSKHAPTLLVVGGTAGLVATAFVAARAVRKAEPVLAQHRVERANIGAVPKKGTVSNEDRKLIQVAVLESYYNTGLGLAKVYGPAIALGTLSAASILYGHKLIHGRHLATLAAYSGLSEQFASYRGRVRQTLGEKAEKDIFNGAHGEYVEDPDHKGEYKLQPVWSQGDPSPSLRPWFDETNEYCKKDPEVNKMWLTGVQTHMNQLFQVKGHLFLNEVKDALNLPRTSDGQVLGWVLGAGTGDNFVDFGFLSSDDPNTRAFLDGETNIVQLNFNVDGVVHDLI